MKRLSESPKIKKEFKKYGVELIENKVEGSQFKKKKQILKLCNTDLIVFTNDDVLFGQNTLMSVIKEFQKNKKITLISVNNQPMESNSMVERSINVGTNIVNRVAKNWNEGDNYLSVIGRFEATRTEWIKRYFELKDDVVSSDQYMYFENKKHGGMYKYLPTVSVYFRNPQSLKEHLRKSSRFQYSKEEMSKYFGYVADNYKVPKLIFLDAIIKELLKNPIFFIFYILISLYTRFFKIPSKESLNPNWQVDVSTKDLKAKL
jgi:cellulose synthase/poly-beta-1,6-N-acetylglucosamine synthase-like glycosyltransferase